MLPSDTAVPFKVVIVDLDELPSFILHGIPHPGATQAPDRLHMTLSFTAYYIQALHRHPICCT